MSTTEVPTVTAVRTWNGPRTKATVTITADGVVIKSLGGGRAARAQAAVVACMHREDGRQYRYYFSLRSDPNAAATEAHKLATATESTLRGGYKIPVTPYTWAVAPLITEEQS
jgi:hypothetical protein